MRVGVFRGKVNIYDFARVKTKTQWTLRSTKDYALQKVYSNHILKGFLKVIQSYPAFHKLTNFYYSHYFAKHKLELVLCFLENCNPVILW